MTIGKRKTFNRSLVCLAVSLLLSIQASSQIQLSQSQPDKFLIDAEEQYLQGQYALSAQSAGKYLEYTEKSINGKALSATDKAEYYYYTSKVKTGDASVINKAASYVKRTGNPSYKQRTALALGQYYFMRNMLKDAIPYYETAGIANLSNREIADVKFELAYCYFNIRKFDKAEPLFTAIKDVPGKYNIAANYYYGLIAYNNNNYSAALECFQRIITDREYRNIVPYYVAEIYYFKGEKEKALLEAKRLLKERDKQFYDNELHLLAAQILFEKAQYEEALPYFEHYYNNTDKIRKEDLYEMAYCYYDGRKWSDAIDKFNQLSESKDSLGQMAMYLLGDCYLKTNDFKSARNAFSLCADMHYNRQQQESAMLLTTKLSYKMGYNDEALSRVNELLVTFPNSKYEDEAKTLLSDLLIKTNNYEEAYKYLREVKNRDALYYQVMQKVTYGYAMLQMQNGNLAVADSLLNMSLQRPVDEKYEMAANYWKGELAYKMRKFDDAINYSERFVVKASVNKKVEQVSDEATLQHAYVNMGYASMEQNDYEAAQWYFNKAQLSAKDSATALDAVLREADAVFMRKGYLKAIQLYDRVIASNNADADYALFQKGIVLGVLGQKAEKMTVMQGLISTIPPSAFANDARYELALIYIEGDKYQQAVSMLMPLTTAYERKNLGAKSWMKIGFCYQQMNMDDKAIEAYRHVVADYPASDERMAALDALKSLYIDRNKPDEYAKLLKDNNLETSNDNTLDSTYYSAAETQYATGNWVKAKQAFGEYLKQYPGGAFVTKAHYYKALSHMQGNEMTEALRDFDAVLEKGWSDFAERTAYEAATIAIRKPDNAAAFGYYNQLRLYAMGKEKLQEAYMGMMQTSFALTHYPEAVAYADTIMTLPNVDAAQLKYVSFIKAKALYESGKQEDAYNIFMQLVNMKGGVGAEANYYIAESYYKTDKLKEAEETANNAIKLASGNEKLTLKIYLLLADILVKQKDYFNAKALLQSIVKNAKIAELKKEASDKLEGVKTLEKQQGKLKQD